jgi:PAS domain S-box-containing protein
MRERPSILVVEDDPDFQEFLLRTLERDYLSDVARNGDEVLAALDRREYDAVLCDLRIPGLSGKDLVQTIRRRSDEETLLIVITGFEQDWSPVEATEATVYFYLKKGEFGPRELRKVLKNGIDYRRERLEKRRYAQRLEQLNQELEKTVEERTHALLESEAKYRNLFQQSLVGIYVQAEGRIQLVNDRLCQMLGITPDELIGQAVEAFLVPVPRDGFAGPPSGREGLGRTAEEVQLMARGRGARTALHCAGPIRFRGTGAVQGCLLDITEWKELEQQFLQNQKMESLGTLVSGIAHEFNNILAAMMPQTEMLARLSGTFSAVARPAEILLHMAEKASRLTQQLLNMSRKPRMEKRLLDVNVWIREAASFLEASLEPSHSLRLELDPLAGRIEGDPHLLDQLLLNLVLNARDAMSGGGTIRIATSFRSPSSRERLLPGDRQRPVVEVRVEDEGCGIPPENLTRIFDPFFTTKETGKGTGLGLSVAHNLVKQHGGEIFVRSEAGKGSAFSILLPGPSTPGREPEPERPGGKVLVSETNPRMLDLFRDILAGMRYEIIPVRNPQEAADVYARQRETIDCVILDGRLESSTGGSSLERILNLNPQIRVILTCSQSTAPLGPWFDSARQRGARIQRISLPQTPEALSWSLEKILYGGAA